SPMGPPSTGDATDDRPAEPPSPATFPREYGSGRPSRIGLVAALAELVADDHPLDLGGALPDSVDTELAPQAFDRLLAHVATAPVDLDGGVGHPAGRLRTHELDGRRERVELLAIGATAGRLPADAVQHRFRGHDLRGHVRKHELDGLEGQEGLAELDPFLREREREVEGP